MKKKNEVNSDTKGTVIHTHEMTSEDGTNAKNIVLPQAKKLKHQIAVPSWRLKH